MFLSSELSLLRSRDLQQWKNAAGKRLSEYSFPVLESWCLVATHDSFITSLTKLLPCPASRELSSSWAAVTLALAAAELRHPALGAPHNTRTRKLFLPGRDAEATPANEISRITRFHSFKHLSIIVRLPSLNIVIFTAKYR